MKIKLIFVRVFAKKLEFMGVNIDLNANNMRGEEKVISTLIQRLKFMLFLLMRSL